MSGGWRRGAAWLVASVVLMAAAGCTGPVTAEARKPVTHTVTIDATSYTPARLTVQAGDSVVWVNKDLIPHTATAKGGSFDSKVLPAGATFRFTAAKAGGFDYACQFHPTMTGRIDVR